MTIEEFEAEEKKRFDDLFKYRDALLSGYKKPQEQQEPPYMPPLVLDNSKKNK